MLTLSSLLPHEKYRITGWGGIVAFDPGTALMGGSLALTAVGTGIGAYSTIAGGNYAKKAGDMQQGAANFQATQLEQNAETERAGAAAAAGETALKTRMVSSSSRARAAASGVNAGVGSPVDNDAAIKGRGEYLALMDLWKGENAARGDINKAAGVRYSGVMAEMGGEQEQSASRLNAAATIAGGGASMLKTYGAYRYPTSSGRAGVAAP